MGRAIVASDLPPIREICGDGAQLYDPSVARSLEVSLRLVLDDDSLRGRLAANARRRFEAALSVTAVRPRLLELLSAVEASA